MTPSSLTTLVLNTPATCFAQRGKRYLPTGQAGSRTHVAKLITSKIKAGLSFSKFVWFDKTHHKSLIKKN